MSEENPIKPVQDSYTIHITLPEQRLSSAISAEVALETKEEVGFNQLLYTVIQKPIDDKSPIVIPPGLYTLRLEATLLERAVEPTGLLSELLEEGETAEEESEPAVYTSASEGLQALVAAAREGSPAAMSAKGKGKGKKTVAPQTTGSVPTKPKRARR